MKLRFTRTGASASGYAKASKTPHGHADSTWRTWACEQAQQYDGDRLVLPVVFTFQATARDLRSRVRVDQCWATAQYVLEGLVAGGLLSNRLGDVVEMRVIGSKVTGADGGIITVADAREPF